MALEIIERQAQQAIEEVQVELGVEPRADHRDDRAGAHSPARSRRRQTTTMIADSSTSVETLWNCSTLLTIVMTRSGGKIVKMLIVNEARPMSRSDAPLLQAPAGQASAS